MRSRKARINSDLADGISLFSLNTGVRRRLFHTFVNKVNNSHNVFQRLGLTAASFSSSFEFNPKSGYDGRLVCVGSSTRSRSVVLDRLNIDVARTQTLFHRNHTHTSKYTKWSFLPLNLSEQFRRAANIYFLATLILTLFLKDSPVSPSTWLVSLIFVVAVTMAKQGYEDFLRHQSDREANETLVRTLRDGVEVRIQSQELEVGEIVYLTENEQIPADLIVLATSHDNGQCFVETANLDGETTLKTKTSSLLTRGLGSRSQMASFVGYIECENPNPKLDAFLGRMSTLATHRYSCEEERMFTLTSDNLLLQGTVLKNTKEVWGVCVYAGTETKMSLNSKITRIKFSTIEKSLNRNLAFFFVVLIVEIVVSTAIAMSVGVEYLSKNEIRDRVDVSDFNRTTGTPSVRRMLRPGSGIDDHWYLGVHEPEDLSRAAMVLLVFFVLYNYIIPISVFVSLEYQKFLSSMFFGWDLELYDSHRDLRAVCNSSDINEELGLLTHLFTDKTGTLTRNEMRFRGYAHDNKVFRSDALHTENWSPFLMVLTLCHSVRVAHDQFVASSPDEKALLEGCSEAGFEFRGSDKEDDDNLSVLIKNKDLLRFRRLAVLDFDSVRKCMSVVIRDQDTNLIHVLTKGAESSVLEACHHEGDLRVMTTLIDHFACDGLRTLAMGHKVIEEDEWQAFSSALDSANVSIVNRSRLLREVYRQLETNLTLVGATAIEDRLQENVVDSIESLKKAGIKTWMLTGDRKETALSLAHSSGLVSGPSKVIDLTDMPDTKDAQTILDEVFNQCREQVFGRSTSLIIDGKTLSNVLRSDEHKHKLSHVALRCPSVIACRLSPIQKSQIVRMVKDADPMFITAAIGDGGNDVSMIQEAHIGLGIIGVEGQAAAHAADFAFTQFRCLKRTLLVHGHWFYRRLATLVQYFFYKNVACFSAQVLFAIHSNWSGQSLFDSLFLFMYNTLYTNFANIVYAVTEQNFRPTDLTNLPALYRIHRGNKLMRYRQLLKWFLQGLWHSAVAFYVFVMIYDSTPALDDHWVLGEAVGSACVLIVNLKMLVEARYWSNYLIVCVILSILSCYIVNALTTVFYLNNALINNTHSFGSFGRLAGSPGFWLASMLAAVLALLPDCTFHAFKELKRAGRRRRKTHPR